MRRTLMKALMAIAVLVAVAIGGGYVYLRQSLPAVDGTVHVSGLSANVDIIRDADAIPHIFAATKADAFFGLGYAHAQDRLWQMEFQRRIGNGRLSEIFGDATLPEDRFLRTVGFGRAAKSAWDHLPADAQAQINAYVAGVNAFISSHHGSALPPEFSLLRFEPEAWKGEDVIVWVKMMAWDLSANYSLELMRHDIEAKVGTEKMAALLPPYPENGLNIVEEGSSAGRDSRPAIPAVVQGFSPAGDDNWSSLFANGLGSPGSAVHDYLAGARIEALGSNNWVVDGTLTASGKPLLANDPHLATHMPSLWYLAHLTAGDFDVIGATLPGTPAVAIGRNSHIAWGETNVAADVEDLFIEKLSADGSTAEFAGAQEPVRHIAETIAVKGGSPVTLDVRITRHGPLVSDAINANTAASKTGPNAPIREPLAFRWTALDDEDRTIVAFLHLNEAKNWDEFTGALRDFVVPSQNFVYADDGGHIGYYAPGHIPIRAQGDGSKPAEGWTGTNEWTGWIPFDELPHTFDPPAHFIVTANNRPEPPTYRHFVAAEYPTPYRAERIRDLLQQRTKITVEDFHAIQADTFSLHAKELLPVLLAHAHPSDAADKTAVDLLTSWDLDASAASAPAAV
ncbi:MAG TPA: penicillin acylase family protein, partial [Vicinamibacterales bacterium]|nr:penicillin acylase family protein [Vicinamibacterales bacterium]